MKRVLLCLTAIGTFLCSYAQTVKTYAGRQYIGSGQYTGYRTNTRDSVYFSNPMGIEVDTAGRLYVSNEHNIFWIKDNTAFLAAGYALDPNEPGAADSKDFAGSVARFSRPAGLAVNPNTNEMMVADQDNNQVRKVEKFINISTQQQVTTFAGVKLLNGSFLDAANASAKFNAPVGIAVAPNGDIYVADRSNHVIRKISGGNVSTIAGQAGNSGHVNGTGTAAMFAAPYNVYLDGGSLLVADYGNGAIRKIDLATLAVTDLITSGLFGPKDLCRVGPALYIVESLCIKRYESGVLSLYAGSISQQGYLDADGTSARFQDLSGIVYHPKDQLLYVVDMGNNLVRTVSPNAKPVCSFTTSTTMATKGQTVILTSTSANKPTSFKWSINPGTYNLLNSTKLTDSVIYVAFAQTGTYNVQLWVSNVSGPDSLLKSNYISVTSVTAPPVADFSASKTTPHVNEIINLIDLSTNTPTSWKWRISPPNYIYMNGTDSTSQIPNVKFTNGDNFTITLIAYNAEGSDTITRVDYIKANGTSVSKINAGRALAIYPNPASGFLNIDLQEAGQLQIVSLHGVLMDTVDMAEGRVSIDVSGYAAGAYIVYYRTNGAIASRKIVVY